MIRKGVYAFEVEWVYKTEVVHSKGLVIARDLFEAQEKALKEFDIELVESVKLTHVASDEYINLDELTDAEFDRVKKAISENGW